MLLSQFIPPSPSRTVHTSLLSMSAALLLPYMCVHQNHLSRFHTYVLIYDIYSLYDLLHSVLKALSSSTSLELSQMHSFLCPWVMSFNWYKKGTILLPWGIVYILVLVDCVFSGNVNLSLMFTMSCSWSRGLMSFWLSFSSGLCSRWCSVLPVTAHGVTRDTWLSPSSKGRTAIRWCQPLPSEFCLTESVTLIVS